MQGIEIEAEGSVLEYVTKAEYRKQRSSLPFMKYLAANLRKMDDIPHTISPLFSIFILQIGGLSDFSG